MTFGVPRRASECFRPKIILLLPGKGGFGLGSCQALGMGRPSSACSDIDAEVKLMENQHQALRLDLDSGTNPQAL